MHELALLAVPFASLAYLTVVGAGIAVGLAPRFPPEAQAALSPVIGGALLAAASVLLPLGVPAVPLALPLAALGAAVTLTLWRPVRDALRAGSVPAVVAVAAIMLAAAPSLGRGDWRATSLYGSTDAYHWSSQARAYLHDPAALPVSEHPDRLTYERSRTQHWAVALPFGLAELAWITRSDAPDVYSALAVLVFCLLPLVTFVLARACLEWRPRLAGVAALVVAANSALLFAAHFSWQQQLAGSAFALAAAACLRIALEPAAPRRETLLAALLAAGALGSYRLGFAPYAGALLAVVVIAYAVSRRAGLCELRRLARAVSAFTVVLAALAAPSLAALGSGLPGFIASGGFSTTFKRTFPDGQIAESLGLVPSVWALQESWPIALRLAWLTVGSLVAATLLVTGLRRLRSTCGARADFLAAGVALTIVGYCVLLLPSFASYLSFKVLSYGAPFLVLLALSALASARALPTAARVAVGALVVASAMAATIAASSSARTAGELEALGVAASRVPPGAVVSVALDDPWEQAWALYYLRNERLSVERPSFLLTAQGSSLAASEYRHRPVSFVLARSSAGRVVWRRAGLALGAAAGRASAGRLIATRSRRGS